jgi:hypothetical protein
MRYDYLPRELEPACPHFGARGTWCTSPQPLPSGAAPPPHPVWPSRSDKGRRSIHTLTWDFEKSTLEGPESKTTCQGTWFYRDPSPRVIPRRPAKGDVDWGKAEPHLGRCWSVQTSLRTRRVVGVPPVGVSPHGQRPCRSRMSPGRRDRLELSRYSGATR